MSNILLGVVLTVVIIGVSWMATKGLQSEKITIRSQPRGKHSAPRKLTTSNDPVITIRPAAEDHPWSKTFKVTQPSSAPSGTGLIPSQRSLRTRPFVVNSDNEVTLYGHDSVNNSKTAPPISS